MPTKRATVNPPEVDAILDLIDREMDAQGITEYRLAKLIEMDQATLGRTMRRESRPQLQTALRLLAAVGKQIVIQPKSE